MTQKKRFIAALERREVEGLVPHFELVFFLTAEKIGKVHASQRVYSQWNQMSASEQEWHMNDVADSFLEIADIYQHDAIFIHSPFGTFENRLRLLEKIRKRGNDKYFLMAHGDPTHSIPDGDKMLEFSVDMYENPDKLKDETKRLIEKHVREARIMAREGLLDGHALCSDYCFNTNPFFNPEQFDEFIVPYLKEIIDAYHECGLYVIKHTDGNIMPIVEQMVNCGPDALHSIDPQAGVSLAEVKKLYGDRVTLIGNVNCGLLQTGTDEECIADVRRALREGMQGGKGYIFSTSNCIYTGLPLERYELMHKIWLEEGRYTASRQ